ncbi:MAG: ATP-dependent metallopeptidase FtsH/Yme1/Tma family protein [Elusimicrobia bacterium]|nr:ATP-dependent metallopeptidase FtsH/Yme1/Tma family protein [Elusimicrobiota bacterium]
MKGLSFWVLLIIGLTALSQQLGKKQQVTDLPYSAFKQMIKIDRVIKVVIDNKNNSLSGKYYDEEKKESAFRTTPVNDPDLVRDLEAHGVTFSGETEKTWWVYFNNFIWSFGPFILIIAFWLFMMKQMQAGGKQAMSFGRSKARLQTSAGKQKITFKDVAGIDEVKEELQEIIAFLKSPKKFQRLGGKIPKGVLLYGSPGTGKTLLAKAVAGEAGVPFFSSSGSEFVEMFVGVGASRVRDLFEQGKRSAPCLLFIDELDAVGRHRGAGIGGGHDEREQTLNQLLVEMDGFDTKEGVILIAATNRPDVLDPALLRPGRFDRHISVASPDLKGREEILAVHTRTVKLAKETDLNVIARRTPGFVGADLANLVNEAALLAARKEKEAVEMEDLEEAIDRVIAGPQRKSRLISDREKKIIAYHESGHALIAKLIPGTDPVHKVSIIPRGPALGYTLQLPLEDRYLTTKGEILDRLSVLLGGRVAEELIFNEVTTGAHNDLSKATELARKMVREYGMSAKLGPLTLQKPAEEIFLGRDIAREKAYSEKTAEMIDFEEKGIIDQALVRAQKLLKDNIDKLNLLAAKLIEREVLVGDEVELILSGKKLPPVNGANPAKEEVKINPVRGLA